MKAFVLNKVCDLTREDHPLSLIDVPVPEPRDNEILMKVSCCGVCHTELDEIEGRITLQHLPIALGHQVVGNVVSHGGTASVFQIGDRVGVAWINSACGKCSFCTSGNENLCESFQATGRDVPGGYAEYMVVDEKFAYSIPDVFSDTEAAPLLCAGAIGYRSLRLTNLKNGDVLGLTGFGASGHLVLKMTRHLFPDTKILVFARDANEQEFARALGAYWAGDVDNVPPEKAHAIIDTTPVWRTIVKSLGHLQPGGRLVINAIRKEEIDKEFLTNINYSEHLWMEKEIKSVANITRRDVAEFLNVAAEIPIRPQVEVYDFSDANKALLDLKKKHIRGAKVLVMNR